DMADMVGKGKCKKKKYTWEGEATFTFERGAGQYFYAEAPDDVWVYVNGLQVIDMGGAYKGKEKRATVGQRIDLDRLSWLADGQQCSLKFFMADRDKGSERSKLTLRTNIESLAPA